MEKAGQLVGAAGRDVLMHAEQKINIFSEWILVKRNNIIPLPPSVPPVQVIRQAG